jgi:NAD(P)-dependent dehydrogenase (short-subunit alcohol dehydrogenase family)
LYKPAHLLPRTNSTDTKLNMTNSQIAIVTAAGRGIGEAVARELAARGYGLALLSSGGGAEALAQELLGVGMTGSVTDPGDLARLVELALSHYGRIDAVVNNTGHPPKGPLLEISDRDWHQGLDLLLLNVVRMARLVTPLMREQGRGAIVNISTFSAFEPDADFPVSSSLRAALAGFTKLYADRYAPDGIRMNNLLPGFVDNYPESEQYLNRIPLGRYARTVEIAQAAAFLVSAEAGYITGQNLRADGGLARSI